VAPGETVTVLGEKAKFLMVMVSVPLVPAEEPDVVDGEEGAAEVEHAASSRAPPTSMTASSRRARRRVGGRVVGMSVVGKGFGRVMILSSAPAIDVDVRRVAPVVRRVGIAPDQQGGAVVRISTSVSGWAPNTVL